MRTKYSAVITLAFALVFGGCNRGNTDAQPRTGPKTYQYLREVGLVRMLLATDDQERIPPVIIRRQEGKLRQMIQRTEVYKQVLAGISKEGVDPDAIEFTKNLEGELDAFKFDGLDTAELIAKLREAESRHLGPSLLPPVAKGVAAVEEENVLAAVGALLEFLNDMNLRHEAEMRFVAPFVEKVRADQGQLIAAKTKLRDTAVRIKEDLMHRFPDQDWTVPEVLPQPIDTR
jgi:hypothetical protein